MEPNEARTAPATIDWGRAIVAGLVATIAITITMALFGQNILKMLGGMLLPTGGTGAQYLAGGVMHLAVGLVYGILYAWLLGPVVARGAVLKGILYGVALTGVALALMPVMGAMMGGGAANPCNPCAGAAAGPCNPCGPSAADGYAANPCNPCGGDAHAANPCNPCGPDAQPANPCNPCGEDPYAANPCNPCGEDPYAANPCNPCGQDPYAANPCNPCGEDAHAANPCNPCTQGGPCNPCAAGGPCNPCGGGGSPWSALISLINHVVYGLTLALVYGR